MFICCPKLYSNPLKPFTTLMLLSPRSLVGAYRRSAAGKISEWRLVFDRFTVKEKTSEAWWRDPRFYPPLLVSNFVIICDRWWQSFCEIEDQSYTRVFNPQTARCLWFLLDIMDHLVSKHASNYKGGTQRS